MFIFNALSKSQLSSSKIHLKGIKKTLSSNCDSCLIYQNLSSRFVSYRGGYSQPRLSYNNNKHLILSKCSGLSINNELYKKNTQSNNSYFFGAFSMGFSTTRTINFKSQSNSSQPSLKRRSTLYYIIAIGILSVGLSYAAVPLYRIFCQAYSYGGTTQQQEIGSSKVESMRRRQERSITIRFNADIAASMTWDFKPQQVEIKVSPGETALAFYSARNPTDRPVIGVSTYNVVPFDAGQYFNKIQCFCFEEQMLNPKEEVSMPVFFYIDPEFADDPKMEYVDNITLSYTFFEVKEGMQLPIPNFMKQ